jgi:DNA ligase-1
MRAFADLYAALDASTSTTDKLAALQAYFAAAAPADAAWAAYFLAGGRPRRTVPTALLRASAQREAAIADWLFEECYQAVGDLAETIALVLPPPESASDLGLAAWVEQRLLPLRGQPPDAQAAALATWWRELDAAGRFVLVKLIGGGWRVGVSRLLVQRALAAHAGVDARLVAQRMMGYTDARTLPNAERFAALVARDAPALRDAGQPYPFFLAHPYDGDLRSMDERLGAPAAWLVEWKYDGIRAQVVRRAGQTWLWTRGEELVTERFPEVVALAAALPDGSVVDGEVLAWRDGAPAPFALLQRRIGRTTPTRKALAEAPVTLVAYDLLEWRGEDLRSLPQHERRSRLEAVCADTGVAVSPRLEGEGWHALAALRAQARSRGFEGLMLKHRDSAYGSGRTKAEGVWWKWKVEPMTADAVLVYAQRGHGRRASVYTDYTFAVWSRPPRDAGEARAVVDGIAARRRAPDGELQLVPFAKAYSGLTDAEFAEVDRVIRATTIDKFGPVRSVVPSLVFEIGFEGIQRSARHRSGIALRFPRMLRLRRDKPLHEADTLPALEALLAGAARAEARHLRAEAGRAGVGRRASGVGRGGSARHRWPQVERWLPSSRHRRQRSPRRGRFEPTVSAASILVDGLHHDLAKLDQRVATCRPLTARRARRFGCRRCEPRARRCSRSGTCAGTSSRCSTTWRASSRSSRRVRPPTGRSAPRLVTGAIGVAAKLAACRRAAPKPRATRCRRRSTSRCRAGARTGRSRGACSTACSSPTGSSSAPPAAPAPAR